MVDKRAIRIGIEVEGRMQYYQSLSGFNIKVTGVKFANARKNECTIEIAGLSQETISYLVINSSPFVKGRRPRLITVDVGRQSKGLEPVFRGDILRVIPNPPPDRKLVISALTGAVASIGIVSRQGGAKVKLSELAQGIADDIGVELTFQATDKDVVNYTYTGTAWGQVQKLAEVGEVSAFLDDDTLVVTDKDTSIKGMLRILNKDTGMIGVPRVADKELSVEFLADTEPARIGGGLRVQSRMNPAADGDYVIKQLRFEMNSHSDAFQYSATCRRL